jgi:lysyl-tRNA synthetase class 1
VTVEPFGKDHASRGGSYDTGVAIAREIFGYQAPVPIIYEWISLKGQGDMSSSKGNVISIADMVEVVPPDVLRYMIFRTQPKKALTFDPGLPMLTLIDELDDPESKTRDVDAAKLALISGFGSVGIPFKHLVSIVQIAGNNEDEAMRIIERGGYAVPDRDTVLRRMAYAKKWLANYAPEDLKFSTQASVPDIVKNLPSATREALGWLADHLDPAMSGDAVHSLFYEANKATGVATGDLFKAFYLSIIGKERGPRAGWFAVTLGLHFIIQRLTEASGR